MANKRANEYVGGDYSMNEEFYFDVFWDNNKKAYYWNGQTAGQQDDPWSKDHGPFNTSWEAYKDARNKEDCYAD